MKGKMERLSKRAQEALRIIRAMRRAPVPGDLQQKAEERVMKSLSLADIMAVAVALDENPRPEAGRG